MKAVAIALAFAVALFPASAFALNCPGHRCDIIGPVGASCYYYFDTGCATTSGNVSGTTMSCNSWPGHSFTTGSGSVSYSMTVPTGAGHTGFSVAVFVDFSDPNSDSRNGISATVIARHNGTVTYASNFFSHNGNQGGLSCARFDSGTFNTSDGDTIEVSYTGTNYTGATMKIAAPIIFG